MIARHQRLATLVCLVFLFALPLTLFLSVTLGQATLLPADNLFSWEPFHSLSATLGVTQPQNHLLSDLILENYPWKRFIIDSIRQGEIPLWNPYLFAGIPFLAAGQHSALYPLSILYYLLPLDKAYGWFTVVNLGLAGVFMFIYMRTLGLGRTGSTFAGVAFQLSGFLIVSVVFPMIVAAAAWLPLILAMCERILRQSPGLHGRPASAPWAIIGALAITLHILAGHVEMTVYTALITALYCLWRLGSIWQRNRQLRMQTLNDNAATTQRANTRPALLRPVFWLMLMGVLGVGLGGIQLVPLFEVVQSSFRAARSSLQEVMSYGFPLRHVLLWLMPNFYGNPAHHTYFDLFTWSMQPVATASGHTDWGIKNYVEGGAYIGIITLILAGIGVVTYIAELRYQRHQASSTSEGVGLLTGNVYQPPVGFFITLGVISIGFIFGTPLYALLYYGLPGINQLNSPFRWVYALTFCLVALAGFGVDWLQAQSRNWNESRRKDGYSTNLQRVLLAVLFASSVGILAIIVLRLEWTVFSPTVTRVYTGLAKATEGFATAEAFFSYEARNVVIAAGLLIASALILLAGRRYADRHWWGILLIGLIIVDLNIAWVGFNPSVNPALLSAEPGALAFLQADKSQWRFTTYDPTGQKPLNANSGWLYGLQDIRGYDSIIPKQYVRYMQLIEPQGELKFNRIAPLNVASSLESPLLDLLNVKYVLTQHDVTIPVSGFKQVYEGDGVRIYENTRVMPRAFTLPATGALLTNDFASAVQINDPRKYVMIDAGCGITDTGCVVPHAADYNSATITVYRNNEVWIDAQITQTSWLILADSYYPGWHAFIRPVGGSDKDEHEVPIGLANGNFRTVRLDVPGLQASSQANSDGSTPVTTTLGLGSPGFGIKQSLLKPVAFTIRFKYSPDTVRIGAFITFISLAILLLIMGIFLWRLFYHEGMTASSVRRVAKNSLVLTGFSLAGRLIDFAFAILMLRVLGPEGAGKFAFAVVIIGWFDILMNFGLNTFLTREVARDKAHANKYLYNTSVLRLLLGFGTAPLVALVIIVWRYSFGLAEDTTAVIVLLALSQLISSMATGLSALFFAYEKAEFPATLTIVSALISVTLRATALLAGFAIVGLAVASILTNLATLAILLVATVRMFFIPHRESDPSLRKGMLRESFPLMLNHLLATLFFKVDVPLLEAMQTPTVVGWYSAAYKYVDAFNIIPAYFTQSIFPAMSRMAKQADESMARAYVLSLKLLVMTALPIAVLTTFLAPFMIGLLGGSEFLPHGAIALTIMIWSIPFGWINSITNYALIAVNQQRALTRAFMIGLSFNIVANLIFIPLYSYQAAAVVTILSELVEGAAFYFFVRTTISRVNWFTVLGRPGLAAAVMAAILYLSSAWGMLIPGVLAGVLVYAVMLLLVRTLTPADISMLAPLIPERLRKRFPAQPSV